MPGYLIVFLTAMVPIIELRGAIPLGFAMGLPPETIFLWAFIGNLLPCFFILLFLDPVSIFLMKHSRFFNKFFTKLFNNTRTKHHSSIQKWGTPFLIIFVSIPLPGTGAWTGCLLAFLFGIKFWKAIACCALGIAIADLLVTLSLAGILSIRFI
ncbi:small multi-drug export protein [Candidatus Peregrinibacteria bacterium]|nr:small multi-drug export protein [Candidatus Peregrinibacteria bacterium]